MYLVGACRSAIGKMTGSLYGQDPVDIASQVIRGGFPEALLQKVDAVVLGNAVSAGLGQNIARQIALAAGIPLEVPSYTVGMVCGSGMQAIRSAMGEVRDGAQLVLCGGIEWMSDIPFALDASLRGGHRMGSMEMTDLMIRDGLTDAGSGVHMGITAENVARRLGISREEQDDYAHTAQQRAIAAVDGGAFREEIVPVRLQLPKGKTAVFETDEQINRGSTREKLATLRPAFLRDGTGTVTAGNASGINDGCAFLLLASEELCRREALPMDMEVVCGTAAGVDPLEMGLGPVAAIRRLLEKTGVSLEEVGALELNEAFAAQALGCLHLLSREHGVDMKTLLERTNPLGSGIGLGHPLGASGARIVVTLCHRMRRGDISLGLASLCIGGGQGEALLLRHASREANPVHKN